MGMGHSFPYLPASFIVTPTTRTIPTCRVWHPYLKLTDGLYGGVAQLCH